MGGCVVMGMYGRGMGVWMHGGREIEHILRVYRRDSVCTKFEKHFKYHDPRQRERRMSSSANLWL